MNNQDKLPTSNLNFGADLFFLDKLMESCNLEAEPEARGHLLKLAYSETTILILTISNR